MGLFEDDKERRAKEAHELSLQRDRRVKRAIGEAYAFRSKQILNPVLPDVLGRGRFADLNDLMNAGMTDNKGVFLGGLQGWPLFMSGDVHLMTYGRTGSGKGRDVILPNLAHVANRSVVVVDPKNGENAYATAAFRRDVLGHEVVFVNPWGLHGDDFPSVAINPLQFVIDLAEGGAPCFLEARYLAAALVPDRKGEGQEWVEGARELVATRIEYLARFDPDNCRLSEIWKVANAHPLEMQEMYKEMMDCGDEGIAGVAGKALGWIEEAGRQFAGYMGQLSLLSVYRPNSVLAHATSVTEFDVTALKDKPVTLYLMLPENMLRGAAPWVSLMLTSIIERVARAQGDRSCLFLADEIANLPKMDSMMTALRLYRSYGIQMWLFAQGRSSLRSAGYTKEEVASIEDNCSVLQMWGVEEKELLDDLKIWGGQTVVPKVQSNFTGAGDTSYSESMTPTARPLLQPEDIRMMGELEQLIRVPALPIIKAVKKPWFEVDRWRDALRDPREVFVSGD